MNIKIIFKINISESQLPKIFVPVGVVLYFILR